MSATHVVYGLRLAANMQLPGLLLQPESDVIDVRIRLKEWPAFLPTSPHCLEVLYKSPTDDGEAEPNLRAGMFPLGEYFGFFYGDGARFAVDRRGTEVWGDWPENYTLEDACTYLIGPVIGFVLRLRGVTCLHASAVAVDGQAIALVGAPGAGKSTTAAAFAHRGFSVIADDVVALVEDTEEFLVPPGYPRVNLWPDSVQALLGAEEALPPITPTWDKRYMALGNEGLNFAAEPLPLRVIYLLGARESELSSPIVEEVTGSDALAALVANTYVNYLLDRDMRSHEFDLLGRVVAGIPVRRVRSKEDSSVVLDLADGIAADARRVMIPSLGNMTSRHQ